MSNSENVEALSPVTLGRALTALRSAHGWTQADLAEASGVAKAQISRYERDVDQPSMRTLRSLLQALHADPDDLRELQDLLHRIVTGRRTARQRPHLSRADLSVLSELMGFAGSEPAARTGGGADPEGAAEAPSDEEVDRLAREAGATVERLVRLHFVRLARPHGR
jgi:transcriptional regulator with XRE-family HTH domain